MGRDELAAALKAKGGAEVRAIRQQAEAEAERYRQQRFQETERQGRISDHDVDHSTRQECRLVDWRVTKQLRNLRLQALHELDRRLWRLLLDEVDRLKADDRQRLLGELAQELPKRDWVTVTVHPADANMARSLFPGSNIVVDRSLGAGLVVADKNDDIRIDNSLRCRFQKQWPGLCGAALAVLEQQTGHGEER